MKKLLMIAVLVVVSSTSSAWVMENLRDAVIKRDMEITRHQDNEKDMMLARKAVRVCDNNDICISRAERRIVRARNAIKRTRKEFL